MSGEQATTFRRLAVLVDRYIKLGEHLQKCREYVPRGEINIVDIAVFLSMSHREMSMFEHELAHLIEESMIVHEKLRQKIA